MGDHGGEETEVRKLPVWLTVKAAYRMFARSRSFAFKISIIPLVFSLLHAVMVTYVLSQTLNLRAEGELNIPPATVTLGFAFGLLTMLSLIPACTAWHRLILHDPALDDSGSLYSLGRPEFGYLVKGIAIALFAAIVAIPILGIVLAITIFYEVHTPWLTTAAMATALLLPGILLVRLMFILPAAALEDDYGIRDSWDASYGNTWRLFSTCVFAALPLLVIGTITRLYIPDAVTLFVINVALPALEMPELVFTTMLFTTALTQFVFTWAFIMIVASVQSFAYLYLMYEEPITLPGETTSPQSP